MKRIFFLLTIGALIGCSKDNKPDLPTTEICKIISLSDVNENYTAKMAYDNIGRIIQYTKEYGNDIHLNVFTYSNKMIKVSYTDKSGGNENQNYEYTLDDNNRVISRTRISASNHSTTYRYRYSNDGYLSSITDNDNKALTQIDYSNGNISSINHINFSEYRTFEYDLSKIYSPYTSRILYFFSDNSDDPDYVLYEQGLFGKLSKNRITKSNYKFRSENKIITLDYTEDSKKNVKNIGVNSNQTKNSFSLDYQCK